MKNDSKINTTGTFLDKDIKQESLAEALIKSMENAKKEFEEYNKIVIKLLDSMAKGEALHLSSLIISYLFKYISATWLTRWYWKGKYEKVSRQYERLMQYKSLPKINH